jgi:hypothetical protein
MGAHLIDQRSRFPLPGSFDAGTIPALKEPGIVYYLKVTPDEETGIGKWNADQFLSDDACRHRSRWTTSYPAFSPFAGLLG